MSLFAELKRRNVFRVAAAYLVVGWLLLQLTDILLNLVGAPDWVGKAIIALLLLGFVPTVAAAWVFEVGPEGIRRDDGATSRDEGPQARRLDVITLGAVVLLLGIMAWQYLSPAFVEGPPAPAVPAAAPVESEDEYYAPESPEEGRRPARAESGTAPEINPHSIAVLPFANLSPDPENEYFADGIAEEVLNILARIEGLRVASRTSSFSLRGAAIDIPEIAARLGVAHVLEGSVRRQGARVRISAQLIEARSDQQLWSDTFDRELEDIFAIQEQIAQAIADALRDTLGMRQVRVRAPTEDLEAYELFLRGRQLFALRGPGVMTAQTLLEQAVARDRDFAAAWAVLAAVNYVMPSYADVDPAEWFQRAAEAAERALALDPDEPTALSVKGRLAGGGSDHITAHRLMRRAVALDPNDANAWLWLGLSQVEVGHLNAARDSIERARALDPLAGIHAGWLGRILAILGEREAGVELLRRAEELGWRASARWFQARLAAAEGESAEAARLLRLWIQTEDSAISPLGREAFLTVAAGLESEPGREAATASILALAESHPDEVFTLHLVVLNKHVEAIEEALRQPGAPGFVTLANLWSPQDQPFREHPGFLVIAERAGLLDFWEAEGYPDFCRHVEAPEPRLACDQ
ncbi:MAG: tetratricopeptide repeat protein [Gammaproteobacteria bacterium]